MRELWEKIVADWPTGADMVLVTFRLLLAIVVGALPGLQRERLGLPAGLRTHILVSLGAAVFMLAALEAGASMSDATRVIQGLATGIGFVGTGAILKSVQRQEVKGLTTAASIWAAAALGTAVGAGRIWLPMLGSLLTLFVLAVLRQVEPTTVQDGYRRDTR
jgi:putative Mg2+ transporter-C (MgtC) family protein